MIFVSCLEHLCFFLLTFVRCDEQMQSSGQLHGLCSLIFECGINGSFCYFYAGDSIIKDLVSLEATGEYCMWSSAKNPCKNSCAQSCGASFLMYTTWCDKDNVQITKIIVMDVSTLATKHTILEFDKVFALCCPLLGLTFNNFFRSLPKVVLKGLF